MIKKPNHEELKGVSVIKSVVKKKKNKMFENM